MHFKKAITHKGLHLDEVMVFWLIERLDWSIGEVKEIFTNQPVERQAGVLYIGVNPHHDRTTCTFADFFEEYFEEISASVNDETVRGLRAMVEVVLQEDTTGRLFSASPHPGLNSLSVPNLLRYLNYQGWSREQILAKFQPIGDLILRGVKETLRSKPASIETLTKFMAQKFLGYVELDMGLDPLLLISVLNQLPDVEIRQIGQYIDQLAKTGQKRVNQPFMIFTLPGLVYAALLDGQDKLAGEICQLFLDGAKFWVDQHKKAQKDAKRREEKEINGLKVVQVVSASPRASQAARELGADVSVIIRPNGNVQIQSGQKRTPLQRVAARLRQEEARLRKLKLDTAAAAAPGFDCFWFLHDGGTMVINGSDSSNVEPTRISPAKMLELVCLGLA